MKNLFLVLVMSTSFSAFANYGEISSSLISPSEVSNLAGVYKNKSGIELEVQIKKPLGQLDLFEVFSYEVSVKMDDYADNDVRTYGIYDNEPNIDIDEDGVITMYVEDDDCDYSGCADTYHTLTFKKQRNGKYSLNVNVEVSQYLETDDIYEYAEDSNGDDDIDESELQNVDIDQVCDDLMSSRMVYARNIHSYDSSCSAEAVYYFNKK